MAEIQNVGLPYSLNGDRVVMIKSAKTIKNGERAKWEGYIDSNNTLYNQNENKYNLGLIASWRNQSHETYPVLPELLETNSTIEVDGFHGVFTYEKPFYDLQQGLRTVASSSDQGQDIGEDHSEFYIYLSERVYTGDILGTDVYYNENQLYVEDCVASELSGTSWKATVILTNPDPEATYPPHLLEPNIQYTRLDQKVEEYSTGFSGVELPLDGATGTVKAEFKLGGVRGVEGYVTAFADAKKRGMSAQMKDVKNHSITDFNGNTYGQLDPLDYVLMAKTDLKTGKLLKSSLRATTVMEYLVEQTLMKRTSRSHMWNKFGVTTDKNGAKSYINEGLWHQMRRGRIIEYSRIGGITRAHISKAVAYIYQNNPGMDWAKKKVKFKGGREAVNNMLMLFQDEVSAHVNSLKGHPMGGFLFANDGQLKKSPVSGPLDSLKLDVIRFTDVPLNGIAGSVTVEHDASLDYMPGQDFRNAGNGARGFAWSTYTLVIWDVTNQSYTNNMYNLPGGKDVKMYNNSANVFLVKPEGSMIYKGTSNGRWDRGKSTGIVSSSKYLAQEFWAYNSSAVWMRDPSKSVVIELAPAARRGNIKY